MPSGAKKRKAAKKKKEQVISSTNRHPDGNGDTKSRHERDSDGVDVGSPASQVVHNQQHSFNHREDERKKAPAPVESHVTDEKSDLDDVETEGARIQHVEHDTNSSCSSNSDDESQACENKSKGEVDNLGSEVAAVENSVKTVTEEVGNGTEISANKSVTDGVESRTNESETKLLLPTNGTPPAETCNVEENTRDSDATPPTVQRTSFLSCCGLFEVLTGSNR